METKFYNSASFSFSIFTSSGEILTMKWERSFKSGCVTSHVEGNDSNSAKSK
jgi:hypothetical protein